jgi:hypothetical protein
MTQQQDIERLIAERYHQFPWYGGISIEEAIQRSIRYRQGLSAEDRQLFDEQIRLGTHPKAAAQFVEIASGRMVPQGSQPERETVAKAS